MKVLMVIVAVLFLGCAALFVVGCDSAESQDPEQARASWDPPTYGTPVVHYVVQLMEEGGVWGYNQTTTDTFYDFTLDYFTVYRVRVAGVDALDRQGPFSLPSNWYSPAESRPGEPQNVKFNFIGG